MAINYYHLQPTDYRGPTPLTVPWRFVPRRFYYMTLHALLLPVPWQTILMMMISMGARDSNRDFRGFSNLYLDSKLLKSADAHQQEFLQRMVLLRFGQRLDAATLHAALADTAGVLCGASEHELFTSGLPMNRCQTKIHPGFPLTGGVALHPSPIPLARSILFSTCWNAEPLLARSICVLATNRPLAPLAPQTASMHCLCDSLSRSRACSLYRCTSARALSLFVGCSISLNLSLSRACTLSSLFFANQTRTHTGFRV